MLSNVSTRCHLLSRSALCRGLSPGDVQMLAQAVRVVDIPAGSVIFRQNEPGDALFVVASGRVKLEYHAEGRPPRVLDYLGRGDHFGDMGVLTGMARTATAEAVVDSQLLALDSEPFNDLIVRVPGLAANISRTLVWRLHQETSRKHRRPRPVVVGVINSSEATRGVTPLLIDALVASGESPAVLTDRQQRWSTSSAMFLERIPEGLPADQLPRAVRGRLQQLIEHHRRVLLELPSAMPTARLAAAAGSCEELFWLVDETELTPSLALLRSWVTIAPQMAQRTHVVWLVRESTRFAPRLPDDLRRKLAQRTFVVPRIAAAESPGLCPRGIGRLARHVRGRRLGLALGGGGARGLAHLGVLRALDRAGIQFDVLAGTSSGALMGVSYCGGWTPDRAIYEFREALTPNRLWRIVPGGSGWYLLARFRQRAWEAMLRKFLEDATIEQLQVPYCTVAVDLITGSQVVADSGDVVQAILDSINLPIVAPPILRDGQALIDGGVLNNVPGDVLPERGADFVVGVDVVSKLRSNFAGNTPETSTKEMQRPGMLQTILRIGETQAFHLATLRSDAVDLLITPDTASADFFDFSQTEVLADVGEQAVEEILPRLKQMLADFDSAAG